MSKTEGIKIRQMQLTDMEAVMQIKNAENWNQTIEDWQFLISSNPKFCLVAIFKNQVIGTVTAINYQDKVAWIGMMLVAKNFRGKGVSKILLNTIIKKLENCVSIKLDATPAGIPVYKKLGFVEEYKIERLVSSKLNNSEQNIDNTSPILKSELSNIANEDEILFGVNRYDLFQFLLKSKKDVGFKIERDNQLKGFVFGRKGSNYMQIGPVVAKSTQLAKILLNKVFLNIEAQPIVIDVLMNKIELNNWLLSIGFASQRTFTRMYLKSNEYSGKTEKQFLISGPELG